MESNRYPHVELVPLPSSAQFLNVIESVFSGMARAIIHNSDFPSVDAAQAAIDKYFAERNEQFSNTRNERAQKIWGDERVPSEFSVSHNCKDRSTADVWCRAAWATADASLTPIGLSGSQTTFATTQPRRKDTLQPTQGTLTKSRKRARHCVGTNGHTSCVVPRIALQSVRRAELTRRMTRLT